MSFHIFSFDSQEVNGPYHNYERDDFGCNVVIFDTPEQAHIFAAGFFFGRSPDPKATLEGMRHINLPYGPRFPGGNHA